MAAGDPGRVSGLREVVGEWHPPTRLERSTGLIALLGIASMFVGALIAALAFGESGSIRYSFLNHNISELGHATRSPLAPAFNYGMILGGTLIAIAMVLFAVRTRTRGVYLATFFGVPGVAGIALVGVFPTGTGQATAHGAAAAMAFLGAFGYSVVTTWLLIASGSLRMPRWLCVPSVGPAIAVLAFILVPMRLYPDVPLTKVYDTDRMGSVRPIVWLPSLLEWSILISFLLWIVFAAGWLAFARRRAEHATLLQ